MNSICKAMAKHKQQNSDTYDMVIVGGGMAGLTLACFAGQLGLKTRVIDRSAITADIGEDLRTTAISYGSAQILKRIGVWGAMEAQGCAIRDIEILDGDSPVLLQFLSGEIEDKSFGWIIENRNIRQALLDKLKTLNSVTLLGEAQISNIDVNNDRAQVELSDGQIYQAKLLIGADGRRSFVRESLGIESRSWSYKQRAVICTVSHENPHDNCAVEHFLSGGPFAALPMRDDDGGLHRSAVVFTEHGPKRTTRMNLDDESFEALLQQQFPERYGAVQLHSKRQVYPLSLNHAHHYVGPRAALIGDAAHGIHPIAGQGLNLGFRDVAVLAEMLGNSADIGCADMLSDYQRKRRFDVMTMVAVTDGLVRLFSNDIAPVRMMRRLGLRAVSKIPAAKRFFMKQAMAERLSANK
jgi:2-octaprenyl-6-methoxyphenol hydroxylase